MGGGHEVDADVGGARRCVLLEVDELLRRRQAPAAVLDGPVQPGVAAVVEEALPAGVVGAAGVPVSRWRRRTVGGDGVVEEGPDLLAEGLVGGGVAQVHRSGSRGRVVEPARKNVEYGKSVSDV